MKKASSGIVRRAAPFLSVTVAPMAISAGGVSPIGEPLAIFPPTVPIVRTCQPPIRRQNSERCGNSASSTAWKSS